MSSEHASTSPGRTGQHSVPHSSKLRRKHMQVLVNRREQCSSLRVGRLQSCPQVRQSVSWCKAFIKRRQL